MTAGTLIRYGQPEPWKVIAQQIGRTKPSRAPDPQENRQKKNDGRPPDTSKELLSTKTKLPTKLHHTLKGKPLINAHQRASYPWHNNSCWLDTSLELTFVTVMQDFPSFSSSCQALLPDMSLRVLFETFEVRRTMEATSNNEDTSGNLRLQRDSFRKYLRKKMIVKGAVMEYQPLFVCDLPLKIL